MLDLDAEPEIWKPVRGYPGVEVSDHGRVRSSGEILPTRRNKEGEPEIRFSYFEQTWQGPVWRLVLLTFYDINTRDWRTVHVDYIDGRPAHCNVYNLRFNHADGSPLIFRRQETGDWYQVRRYAKKIRVVDTGEIFESARALSEAWGVNQNAVYMTLRGQQKTIRGRKIEYFE